MGRGQEAFLSTGFVGKEEFTTLYSIHSSVLKYFIKNKFIIILEGRETLIRKMVLIQNEWLDWFKLH